MNYRKQPLTFEQQADLLISRGLQADRGFLISQLKSVYYYRITSYLHPFKMRDEKFKPGTTFEIVWLRSLNAIRNICAHHSRLWNRELGYKPLLPNKRKYPEWYAPVEIKNNRVFGILTILKYLLDKIAPQSKWSSRLIELLKEYCEIPLKSMGFPDGWTAAPIWKNCQEILER